MAFYLKILPYLALFIPLPACAAEPLSFTQSGYGVAALAIFFIAYFLVVIEEFIDLRKSKPVVIAAGVIWALVALAYSTQGEGQRVADLARHVLLEYGELLLFLIVAMTYINTIEERQVFAALRARLVASGYSLRTIFWLTGVLAFFISAIADNLTTALVMSAVVITVGQGHPKFIALACINVVVAANAGGVFSPFGDITTLMVWQKGTVSFWQFFHLVVPALVNWFIPALLMSFALPIAQPAPNKAQVHIKIGGRMVVALFVLTLVITVGGHQFLHLPPVLGMMTGLGLLKSYSYFLKRAHSLATPQQTPLNAFSQMQRIEWDTLLFFYGIILSVGGLGALGYLAALSNTLYIDLGPTTANVLIGLISAVVDNIPVMYAVLTMNPDMSLGQWLLVTLTAGVGGSLLSIGSAAGVAVMGQAPGVYTFFAHLRWTWAIALGYGASIATHLVLNVHLM